VYLHPGWREDSEWRLQRKRPVFLLAKSTGFSSLILQSRRQSWPEGGLVCQWSAKAALSPIGVAVSDIEMREPPRQ
jgi:hypothetical protein